MTYNPHNNDVYFKVAKLIAEQLNIKEENISESSSFDKLGADSLDQIEILLKVEDLFGIEITDDQAAQFACIKDVVNCISKIQNI